MRKDDRQIDGRGGRNEWCKHARTNRSGHNKAIRRKVRMYPWIDLLHEHWQSVLDECEKAA